ncbi:hypothetical protein FIV06_06665 [Labrenzia sp. THAF191b]|nr:hypothetical protein FIV06_06665 [Labrenzia sp. THAF191b]QFT03409.1 hypothetical protein FIV05_06665 [Labrenzia sp. THAF191a]QFT14951.1 hypothetical protein FIV03_06670 [Labrenzia sp. THAF187b]
MDPMVEPWDDGNGKPGDSAYPLMGWLTNQTGSNS